MKRVILVRHAKAEPFGYENDFFRDLTKRGISDAEKISCRLKELDVFPQLVIASPSTRTMHTAKIYCRNLGYIGLIREEDILYQGITTHQFVELLHELPGKVQTAFVFGHNPTIHSLVFNLLKNFNSDMPTCSTIAIDFQVDKWQDVSARCGEMAFQLTPKNI